MDDIGLKEDRTVVTGQDPVLPEAPSGSLIPSNQLFTRMKQLGRRLEFLDIQVRPLHERDDARGVFFP